MNTTHRLTIALFTAGSLLVAAPAALAQAAAPAAAPAGGGGGGMATQGTGGSPGLAMPAIDLYNAVARVPLLNDTELTMVTRMEESVEAQVAAAAAARTALTKASVAMPSNRNDITAKSEALAAADLALALARSTAFAKLRTDLKVTSSDKLSAIVNTINMPGGAGRGGGGRGAAPAAGAVPAAAPGRGN
jgi:hypothetical protein